MTHAPLAGVTVLVTRPSHQADALCQRIEHAGGAVLRLPALRIEDPADTAHAAAVMQGLEAYDLAVFVSANAVERACALRGGPLPAGLRTAAVGPATALALTAAGAADVITPQSGFDSEALLAHPALAEVAGQRILVVRGDGGRALLGETLTARGALVEFAAVYRRVPGAAPSGAVADALRRRRVDATLATSADALEALVGLCTGDLRHGLLASQLVVASARMVKLAESHGFAPPLIADAAGDGALVDTLIRWAGDRRTPMNHETSPETRTAPAAPLRRDPTTTTVAWAAAVIAAIALAGGIYLEKEREKLKDRISEVRFEMRDMERALVDRSSDQHDAVAGRVDALQRQTEQLANGLEYLRSQAEGTRGAWVRTEVEYVLRMAMQHLEVERDPRGAIAALRAAEQRLRDFADPAYASVIARIEQDIAALEAVPVPDIEHIMLTLDGIANAIDGQPLVQPEPLRDRKPREAEPGFAGVDWSGLWRNIRESFKSMVTIRREGRPEQLLLAPREEYFVHLNAQLKLEGARVAALRRDGAAFHDSVRSAHAWIARWYDTDDPTVQAMLGELEALEAQPLEPALPDIGGALRRLRGADGQTGPR